MVLRILGSDRSKGMIYIVTVKLLTCPRAGPNGGDGDASPAAINIRIIPTTFVAADFLAILMIRIFYLMPTILAEARP